MRQGYSHLRKAGQCRPPRRYVLASVCLLVSLVVSSQVAAAGFSLDLNLGQTSPSVSEYRSDSAGDIAAGYLSGNWSFRAGYTALGELELRDSPGNSYIEVSGAYLQANHTLRLGWLDVDLGGGAFFARSEAVFSGNSVANEREVRPFLEVRAVKPLSSLVSLQAGYRHFDDVSGSDLGVVHAGVRFSFQGGQ